MLIETVILLIPFIWFFIEIFYFHLSFILNFIMFHFLRLDCGIGVCSVLGLAKYHTKLWSCRTVHCLVSIIILLLVQIILLFKQICIIWIWCLFVCRCCIMTTQLSAILEKENKTAMQYSNPLHISVLFYQFASLMVGNPTDGQVFLLKPSLVFREIKERIAFDILIKKCGLMLPSACLTRKEPAMQRR